MPFARRAALCDIDIGGQSQRMLIDVGCSVLCARSLSRVVQDMAKNVLRAYARCTPLTGVNRRVTLCSVNEAGGAREVSSDTRGRRNDDAQARSDG
jgi:hypothetical protein